MEMIGERVHAHKVQQVLGEMREKNGEYVLKSSSSNTLRNGGYKEGKREIDLSLFTEIIEWNPEEKWIHVEPRIDFDTLTRFTLKKGFVCPVVPEFKTITVGGAIMGAALESSSHRWGEVSDITLEYEVILGNGDLLVLSRDSHSDLFCALPGSYGTLAILTAVKLKLIPAKKWVVVSYQRYQDLHQMADTLTQPAEVDFIEGMIYNSNHSMIIQGQMSDGIGPPLVSLNKPWSPWFAQHVEKTQAPCERLPLYDYLFRFDRAAFWMAKYVHSPRTMLKLLLNWGIPQVSSHSLDPSLLFRLLFGWTLSSKKLYRLWHRMPSSISEKLFFIHDFYIPFSQAKQAIDHFIEKTAIFPIWLCPVKGNTNHFLSPSYGKAHFLNIGLYGIPKKNYIPSLSAQLEQDILTFQGRKMLYSFCYYDSKTFAQVYQLDTYELLRKKYHAHNAFPSLYEKVSVLAF